jgi:hypothetical protein
MADERGRSDAEVHFDNCKTLADHCRKVRIRYQADGKLMTRLEAGAVSEHVDKVMATLRQAHDFLNQEDVKKRYRPEYLQTIDYVIASLPEAASKALDFGRGGFNRFGERYTDLLFGIVYLTDMARDPYNAGYPDLLPPLTTEGPAIRVPDNW